MESSIGDLHLHLGASVTSHFLWELAHEQGIHLPEKDYWKFIKLVSIPKKTTSDKYLKKVNDKGVSPFVLSHKIQSSPYAMEKCTHYAISRAYREFKLNFIELRFNPIFRSNSGMYDLDKIILSAIIGMQKAIIEYPIQAGLILETDRQFSQDKHWIIVKKAIKYKNLGIIGVDVSGPSPKEFSLDDFIEPLRYAKKKGLKITFHTGEFTDADEVIKVIQKIKPHRLGHGVKAAYNQKALELIRKNDITLELCPTSNIRTRVVRNWKEFGFIIRTFLKNNIKFTINSDGPEFLNTDVRKEFDVLKKNKILNDRTIKKIISWTKQARFI